ncbi:MAG TPA: hypothetical protein VE170_01000 [Candidatus Limnocylindria bacterium]|nr:hypothetical protein [Candidatus Limnocylindria bacterium]
MDIHIELSQNDVDYLLHHLPLGTALRQKLGYSYLTPGFPVERPVEFSNEIDCSEGDALALLSIAREYCPEAVQKIQDGLRLSGITSY